MRSDVEEWNKRPLHTDFNPRSLHGERQCDKYISFRVKVFQSTLPAWGATPVAFFSYSVFKISIHAPRMGSDYPPQVHGALFQDFNPRSPHGERPCQLAFPSFARCISIHAPRMGSDSTAKAYSSDRIKWSTLREPHFFYSKNACFSPIVSMCAATSRTKNQRIRVSFGSYPGLAPTCFTLDWYRFPRL